MSPLRLLSLNIEHSRHLSRVAPFLREARADVVCLQELNESDIPLIEEALGYQVRVFSPMTRPSYDCQPPIVEGIGIFSRGTALKAGAEWYAGNPGPIVDFDKLDEHSKKYLVAFCDIEHEGVPVRIATTHFVWTPKGDANDYQRAGARKLLDILRGFGEFVLCGDFNAPRFHKGVPGEIYSLFAEHFKDNIPPEYITSIDAELHRIGKIVPEELADKMVDYLFTTPKYRTEHVKLVDKISDHMAIAADLFHA